MWRPQGTSRGTSSKWTVVILSNHQQTTVVRDGSFLGVCLVRLTSLRLWDKGEMWCLGIWARHEKQRMVLEVAGVAVTISYSDGVRVLA